MNIKTIAETAFTHSGDISYLKKQIDLAAKSGVNYIKFQIILNVSSAYTRDNELYTAFHDKIISKDGWLEIINYSVNKGLEVIILPIDYDSLIFAIENENLISAIEIHSICLNDYIFLKLLNEKEFKKLIILGVGGHTSDDINYVIEKLNSDKLLLMFGHQNFPTRKSDNNLGKIASLINEYNVPVGFADHTPYFEDDSDVITIALALGATLIEKHIIIEHDESRPDYYSAANENGFLKLKKCIENYIDIYGSSVIYKLSPSEHKYHCRQRKIVAKENIIKGERLTIENLTYKVTDSNTELEPKDFEELLNKKANSDISIDSTIILKYLI